MSRVCLGVIAGAHGVRGLVQIKSYTEVPLDLTAYGPLGNEAGTRLHEVTAKSTAKGMVLAAVAGIADRDAAEALKGTRLYVDRAALPAPEEEEFYHADLIGLVAEDSAGQRIGPVIAVQNFGAGDLLEIEQEAGQTLLLPFTKAAVPEIDLAGKRLVAVVADEVTTGENSAGEAEDG